MSEKRCSRCIKEIIEILLTIPETQALANSMFRKGYDKFLDDSELMEATNENQS
jgi:hypothetical protein